MNIHYMLFFSLSWPLLPYPEIYGLQIFEVAFMLKNMILSKMTASEAMTHPGPDTLEGISWTAVSFYMYKEMFLLYLEKHTVATYFLFLVSPV